MITSDVMTMSYSPHMLSAFRGPWNMTDAGLAGLRGAVSSGMAGEFRSLVATIDRKRLEARTEHARTKGRLYLESDEYFDRARDPHIRASGVAVFPVNGPLFDRGDWCYQGYDQIVDTCLELEGEYYLRRDQKPVEGVTILAPLKAVVMPINSPGGMCAGLFEACAAIRRLRELVDVYTVAAWYVGSAAEVIACQGTESFCSRDSERGHLGTWTAHEDISAFLAGKGITVTYFELPDPEGGGVKTFFASEKPLTEEAKAVYGDGVRHYFDALLESVTLGRPKLTAKDVIGLKAQIFRGAAAIEAGLADGEATTDALIATLEGRE